MCAPSRVCSGAVASALCSHCVGRRRQPLRVACARDASACIALAAAAAASRVSTGPSKAADRLAVECGARRWLTEATAHEGAGTRSTAAGRDRSSGRVAGAQSQRGVRRTTTTRLEPTKAAGDSRRPWSDVDRRVHQRAQRPVKSCLPPTHRDQTKQHKAAQASRHTAGLLNAVGDRRPNVTTQKR